MPKRIDCPQSGNYCRDRQAPPSRFDRRSFRTVSRGDVRIVVGCPRGKWNARRGRCTVGLRAQTILRPLSSAKCRAACKVR